MIKITNLLKKYGNRTILDIEELIIEDDQRIAFMGKNGTGKTTLSEIIMGIIKPTSGKVEVDIQNLRKNAVFQETNFSDETNIYRVAKLYRDMFKSDVDIDSLFDEFELSTVKKNKFQKLSGGQQQKFKFLIASLNNPNLILLDELSTSLDYEWRRNILQIIKNRIAAIDATMLLVSHEINEVATLCQRVILLDNTKILKDFKLTKDLNENKKILEKELGWDNESAI